MSRLGIVYLWISLWLRVYFNLWLMHSFKVDLHDLRQRATAARNPKPNVATKRHTSPLLRVQTELADDGLPPPSSLVYHEFGCDINFKVFRITLSKPPAWRDKAPPQKRSSSGQCPAVAEPGIAAGGSRSFVGFPAPRTALICGQLQSSHPPRT